MSPHGRSACQEESVAPPVEQMEYSPTPATPQTSLSIKPKSLTSHFCLLSGVRFQAWGSAPQPSLDVFVTLLYEVETVRATVALCQKAQVLRVLSAQEVGEKG